MSKEDNKTKTDNEKGKEIVQSAKVYVFDFHFESESKLQIAMRKGMLDKYFDKLLIELKAKNEDMAEVFLRKH